MAKQARPGLARQRELENFVARTGMLICGPNCLGVLNFTGRSCGYSSISAASVATGGIGLVSQSGTIVVAMVRSARGFGFSHMVSSGNECVLDSADYLGHLVDDPSTRVLVSYLEGIRDPAKFLDVADRAFAARKPLIVVKSGRSDDGSAASAAHTGALAGSYKVQSAIFRQKGIVHCDDLDEMTEAMEMFSFARPPSGPGIGVIGISGGENALVMDQAAAIGLPVPKLSAEGRARLAALLPWFARPENPIDPTGAALGDAETYVACIEVLAAEPGIGVVVVSQDSPAAYDVAVAKYVVEAAKRTGKCIVYLNNFSGPWNPAILAMLREAGVPYLQGLREGLKAVKALIDYAARQEAGASAPPPDATPSPRRAEAIALLAGAEGLVTEDTAKRVLALYGLPVSPETLATTQDEALAAANAFGYPVVAKIVSPDVAHKAASGGVRLDLRSAADVASAWRDLATGFAKAQPQARIAGVLVQPMAKPRGAIEIILGVKRDAQFGPMVMFGLGGVFTEVLQQVALRRAPLAERDARDMIAEVEAFGRLCAKLHPGADAARLVVPLLMQLSRAALDLADAVGDIDVNPVILDPAAGTAVIVDAMMIPSRHSTAA